MQEPDEGEALAVLRGIWEAQSQSRADLGPSNAKVCRNMKNIGFAGMAGDGPDDGSTAGPVDEDQRAAWRARLEREGKLVPGATSVRDLIMGSGN